MSLYHKFKLQDLLNEIQYNKVGATPQFLTGFNMVELNEIVAKRVQRQKG